MGHRGLRGQTGRKELNHVVPDTQKVCLKENFKIDTDPVVGDKYRENMFVYTGTSKNLAAAFCTHRRQLTGSI